MAAKTNEAKKTATKKAVSHAKPKAVIQEVATVNLVPIELIDVIDQVRTSFDEEAIIELARDIQTRGLLQPVLLNPNANRFTLIAGERRLRACKYLKMTAIPALITKASRDEAMLMQLAENVQREDLSLQDEIKAVRQLYEHFKSVEAVADQVKKSKAWVSKRLAMSYQDLSHRCKRMIESGITEDLEILRILQELEKIDYGRADQLEFLLTQGKANRDKARDIMKAAKEEKAKKMQEAGAGKSAPTAKQKEEEQRHLQEQLRIKNEMENGTGELFIKRAMQTLENFFINNEWKDNSVLGITQKWAPAQLKAVHNHLAKIHQEAKKGFVLQQWAKRTNWCDSDINYIEQLAGIAGLAGYKLDNVEDMLEFLVQIEKGNKAN